MFGSGDYTAKIAYTIIVFGLCILGLQTVERWYIDWPW